MGDLITNFCHPCKTDTQLFLIQEYQAKHITPIIASYDYILVVINISIANRMIYTFSCFFFILLTFFALFSYVFWYCSLPPLLPMLTTQFLLYKVTHRQFKMADNIIGTYQSCLFSCSIIFSELFLRMLPCPIEISLV